MTPLDTLKKLRLGFPTPLGRENNGSLLNALCLAFPGKLAMYAKPDNNSAILPNGKTISRDTIIDLDSAALDGYDVFRDSEGAAEPVWNFNDEHHTDARRVVHPIPTGEPVPVPVPTPTPTPIPPTPQPPTVDLSPVIDRLNQLEDSMAHVLDVVLEQFAKVSEELNAERQITARLSGFIGGNITGTIARKD